MFSGICLACGTYHFPWEDDGCLVCGFPWAEHEFSGCTDEEKDNIVQRWYSEQNTDETLSE